MLPVGRVGPLPVVASRDVPAAAGSLALARKVKRRHPDTVIVFGDRMRRRHGQELLKQFPFVDAVVNGEAEEALPTLVRRVVDKQPGPMPESWSGANRRRSSASRRRELPLSPPGQLPIPDLRDFSISRTRTAAKSDRVILRSRRPAAAGGERRPLHVLRLERSVHGVPQQVADRALTELQV